MCGEHPDRLRVDRHFDSDAGFLTPESIAEFVSSDLDADIYICGPGPFMDLVESTLQTLGVEQDRIFIERFLVEQQEKTDALIDDESAAAGGDAEAVPDEVTVAARGQDGGGPLPAGRHPARDGPPGRPAPPVLLRGRQLRHLHGLLEGRARPACGPTMR